MAAPAELDAMRRAIALSAAGLGATSPNPPVGCVIVGAGGTIAGEGYHQRKGEGHAETRALAAAGERARGATAVVTLEPCNHHGRTPACRQALLDAGVSRVVIALMEPTSRAQGGAAALRAAGVDVETGVLAGEARLVVGPWLAALALGRPVISWAYLLSGEGIAELPHDSPDAGFLRLNADAVLHADGRVEEAVPGSHGAGILELGGRPPGMGAGQLAARLHASGVRLLLLQGALDVAGPFLGAGLIDRVVAYLAPASSSVRPAAPRPWGLLPPGFGITEISRVSGFVRVTGRRP